MGTDPLDTDHHSRIAKVFRDAICSVSRIPVTSSANHEIILKTGYCIDTSEGMHVLCCDYLEFCELYGDEQCRREARDLVFQTPRVPLGVLSWLIAFEAKRSDVDVAAVRGLFELALAKFGRQSPELWMDLIRFEHSLEEFTKVQLLHSRAAHTLADVKQFAELYEQWKNSWHSAM
eukprot:NODE_5051_length_606_cov_93.078995_g4360_i0.p1 GENE.NODE_5051_length_606_cov_93.078995_g4360_i0~~NODE_5051_length_606_cov_93.078995_g4360_i0.p1  ORF type:complete len:176 (+),score=52.86 NODE_5051_length_606_cov_93.078995_g4360_i0:30-557(+)